MRHTFACEGLHVSAKHAPEATSVGYKMHRSWVEKCAIRDARDVPFKGRKMSHEEQSRHHEGHHSVSGEPSGMVEGTVHVPSGHNEEICAIVTM